MADNEIPMIRVISFKTSYENRPVKGDPVTEKCDAKGYKVDASGRRLTELQAVDYVTYSPSHSPLNTRTTERVHLLIPDPDRMGLDQDGEKLRFMTHRWNQIEPAYRAFKEGQADKVRLPNMRDMRKQAKLFLENTDTAKAAEREAAKDATIAELVERQAAMEAMIEELTKPKGKAEKVA